MKIILIDAIIIGFQKQFLHNQILIAFYKELVFF
jgi:hypothetical protein